MIPESPRWLLCKGRTAEVAEIVRKVCEVNKRECPPNVEMLLKPPPSNNQTGDDGCISLFGNSYLRLITICFPCIWFTINLVYYGLILNMNTFGGNVYLNTVSFYFFYLNLAQTQFANLDLKQNFNARFCWNKFSNRSHSLICISVFVLLFVVFIRNVFVQNEIYSHFCSVDVLRYHMARCQQSRTNRKIFFSVLFSLRHILFISAHTKT